MPSIPRTTAIEAKVTSKGQVTLPKELRMRLGIQTGSRVRFTIPASGAVEVAPVRYNIKDLWRIADQSEKPEGIMSFKEMNEAKARRLP